MSDEQAPVTMRAKMYVASVTPFGPDSDGKPTCEVLTFGAVYSSQYTSDGADENNTFARFTPSANLHMQVQNPDLLGKFAPGDTFYVDFTPAPR